MRASTFASALAALLAFSCPAQAGQDAAVAWLRDGKVEMRALTDGTARPDGKIGVAKVPLGSLWKLFVFAYLAETHAEEPAYVCASNRSARSEEERYCCAPGGSIGRHPALARSCAPYFAPARLGIRKSDWLAHWKTHASVPWLINIERLQPATQVGVDELLRMLAAIGPQARAEARSAMLATSVEGYGREAWTRLGTGLRYKTYSWHRADGSAFGGAAGWLADGTPFWFGARGSSRSALNSWASQLVDALPVPRWREAASASGDVSCVDVDFFARYPIRAVWQATESVQAKPGELQGSHRIEFVNGNWLRVASRGELSLAGGEGIAPAITGRFTINDYIARVIDREGSAHPAQAARALAIAARSYLVQNARFESGCWRIADSSRAQRVSANPPSDAASAAAWFTDGIVLNNVTVQYRNNAHNNASGIDRLAWRDAVAQAGQGWNFDRILAKAYPRASVATLSGREECTRLDAAERWLVRAVAAWQARLRAEPGFEALDTAPVICALSDGHPYSDQQRLRIYIRGWRSLDERVTLAHEYLHLALRFHPNGADERYVERLARQLVEG